MQPQERFVSPRANSFGHSRPGTVSGTFRGFFDRCVQETEGKRDKATVSLDVQSRHVVEWIQSESLRLLCPELTDPLKGREPTKTLQALGEVVRLEECGQVRSQALVGVVIEPSDRGVLDGAVHPFDLPIGPRMFEFREAMLNLQRRAGEIEGMGTKRLMRGQPLLNLGNRPAAMRRRELKPVIGQDRVNRVRDTLDQ